ncbi:hypothetical protein EE612_036710 [Oryza sativa]|nr:hypothetical protein EE612_036710 [Oryza sativa]
MGFNPPVPQKDSEWEIRVAVLLSLLLQVILIFVGPMRKRTSHPVPCFAIWACYLLADWVADLALGLLLNNLGNIGSSSSHLSAGAGGGPPIFAFWTPFLLLHLGGPDTMTAYSVDDNELWRRHLIGLLFELFSALVVFSCSIRSNPMIPATALIFVVGVIKYGERTYSLYSGSVDGVIAKIFRAPDPGPNYAKLMTVFGGKRNGGLLVEITIANGEASKAKEVLQQGSEVRLVETTKSLEAIAYEFFTMFRVLYVDINLSYKERRISQAYFLDRRDMTADKAFEVMEIELNYLYDMVYTKAPVSHSSAGCVLRFICTTCLVVAIVLFVLLDKTGILPVDRGITYALLLGGLALDVAAILMLLCSNRMIVFLEAKHMAWLSRVARAVRLQPRRWSERTSQLNFICYCLGKPKEQEGRRRQCCRRKTIPPSVMRFLIWVANKVGVRETLDDFFFIQRKPVTMVSVIGRRGRWCNCKEGDERAPTTIDALAYVFVGLQREAIKFRDSEDYYLKKLRGYRGEGTLLDDEGLFRNIKMELTKATREELNLRLTEEESSSSTTKKKEAEEITHDVLQLADKKKKEIDDLVKEKLDGVLRNSIGREFDESLLLWHIATDLCCHREREGPRMHDTNGLMSISETLSEYMLYLLVRQPEMLSATAGIGLLRYRDTCAEARRFFKSAEAWDPNHDDARRMLLSVNTSKKPADVKGDRSKSVLFDACILAKVLRELDDDTMWRVVAGVWREMLTYAAGKCQGSTHVRQLSRGGELITMAWFLMAHMGIGDVYRIGELAGDSKAKLIIHDQ